MPTVGQRIRAAQAEAGYTSVDELAAAINEPGFGTRTIRRIIGDRRALRPHEAAWLSAVTSKPADWFYEEADEPAAGELVERLARIEQSLAALRAERERASDTAFAVLARIEELVRRQSDLLGALEVATGREASAATRSAESARRLDDAARTIAELLDQRAAPRSDPSAAPPESPETERGSSPPAVPRDPHSAPAK